jgi:hypothetical protein
MSHFLRCPEPDSAGPGGSAFMCRGRADGESECQKARATIAGSRSSHLKTTSLGSKVFSHRRFGCVIFCCVHHLQCSCITVVLPAAEASARSPIPVAGRPRGRVRDTSLSRGWAKACAHRRRRSRRPAGTCVAPRTRRALRTGHQHAPHPAAAGASTRPPQLPPPHPTRRMRAA